MKKRILCLLLCLVLLLSLLPAAAMAEYSAMYHITVIGGTAAWVDFNPDDPQGQEGTNITAPAGATISLVADAFIGGNFKKWKVLDGPDVTFKGSSREATVFVMPEGDLVIKAVCEGDEDEEFSIDDLHIGEFTVKVIGGTAERRSVLGLFDVLVDLTADDPPEGMHFVEWRVTEGSAVILKKTEPETTMINIKDDVTVQAVFEYDSGGQTEDGKYAVNVVGGTASPTSAAPGESVAIVADSDKMASFEKWQVVGGDITLASETNPITTFTMPESAVTVRAVCKGDDDGLYSITVTDGGYASKTRANPGETVMLYTNNFEASNFLYWECADDDVEFENSGKAITSFIMPDHDVTIKAVSLTGKTICRYKINGGVMSVIPGLPGTSEGSTAIKSQTYMVTADAPPSGMVFDKWVLDSPTGSAIILTPESSTTMVMCMGDFEMTATYKSNGSGGDDPVDPPVNPPVGGTCYLIYQDNGGVGSPALQTFKAGEKVTVSTVKPTREGYTFLGWSDDSNDTESVYAPGRAYVFSETTVLYAIWQTGGGDTPADNTYSITVTGGTASASKAKAGDPVTVSLNSELSDSFVYWEVVEGGFSLANPQNHSIIFTMPAGPVSLRAVTVSADPDTDAVTAFVNRLYTVCLGRTPSKDETDYYVWLLTQQGETGIGAASKFIFTDEFSMKNYCDRHYTLALYNAFMGRQPAEDEIANWVWRLQQGDTREKVFNEFALSGEFAGICSAAGITPGTAIPDAAPGTRQGGYCTAEGCTSHEKICGFAEMLYAKSLDRQPGQDEIDAWHYYLVHGDHTGRSAARYFFFCDEFVGHGFNSEEYARHLYVAMFGRAPGAADLEYWAWEMNFNNMSREAVFNSFADSDEFALRCQQHNVVR